MMTMTVVFSVQFIWKDKFTPAMHVSLALHT